MEPNSTHDGAYFQKLAATQKGKLMKLADISEHYLESDQVMPEDHKGMLRSATGKARLLIKERFKQFEGLCEKNLNPKENELPVGPKDLAGLWDLIMIEVRSLHNTFRHLAMLAKNNWQAPMDVSAIVNEDKGNLTDTNTKPTLKKTSEGRRSLHLAKSNGSLDKTEIVSVRL